MAYSVVHFGPLVAVEYSDGYVFVEDVACGAMRFDTYELTLEMCQHLTFDAARVTCKRCSSAIEAKGLKAPDVIRMEDEIVSPVVECGVSPERVRLARMILSLPVEPLSSEQIRQLNREAVKNGLRPAGESPILTYRADWLGPEVPRLAPPRIAAPELLASPVAASSNPPTEGREHDGSRTVTHFGPLQIREFADGYVEISDVACGRMYFTADNITPKECRRLTIDPARVTCMKCRAAIEAKSITVPQITRVPDNISSPINPSEYDEDKVKLVRSLVGLPDELPPLERRHQLHRWSVLDSMQSASSLSDRGRDELEKVKAYRARWAAMNTPRFGEQPGRPAAILPAAPSLSGKKLHLWPKQISEYADGYTRATGTGCGDRQTADSEDDQFFVDDLTSDPALVTCAKCRKSKLFKQAEADPAGWAEQAVQRIPRMRTAVLKHPERYDIDRNNALRARIGLPDVVRNETALKLIAAELDQQEYYANHRIESGKAQRERLEEMLNDYHEPTQPEEPFVQSKPQQVLPVAQEEDPESSTPFPTWVIVLGAMACILLLRKLF